MTEMKKINNVEVTKDCYRKLKVLSVQKDSTVPVVTSELLEKIMSKKNNHIEEVN